MRGDKVKYPKMKHATFSQLLIYFPAFSFFLVIFTAPWIVKYLGTYTIIIVAASAVFSIWYLFHFAPLLILSDAVFSTIRCWKRARVYFETARNGTDRETARLRLSKRRRGLGKAYTPLASIVAPTAIFYKRKRPTSVFWFAVEKISVVYSVPYLDKTGYLEILRNADTQVRAIRQPKNKMSKLLMDKRQKEAPIATVAAVVILTDRVDPALLEQGIKGQRHKNSYILPCVAVLSSGRYYYDSLKEPHFIGLSERPIKNYAIDLMKKQLFGGRLPLRGNDRYLPFEMKDISLNMSVWDYAKQFRSAWKEGDREERGIAKKLTPGEVRIKDDCIYCKIGKRTARFLLLLDEGTPREIQVLTEAYWCQPRRSIISKKDMSELQQRMRLHLVGNGYTPEFIEPIEDDSTRATKYDTEK